MKTCGICQRVKPAIGKKVGLLQAIVPEGMPARYWGLDFVGPLPKGTNRVK